MILPPRSLYRQRGFLSPSQIGIWSSSGSSGETDPHFANVVLLLNFIGADESTTFDEATGKSMTAAGNAQIDTAQEVNGTSSGLFDGSGDYLHTPDHADFDIGTSDLTFEAYVRFPSLGVYSLLSCYGNSSTGYGFQFRNDGSNRLQFFSSGDSPTNSFSWTPSVDTWYHIAITRESNTVRGWVAGSQVGSDATNSESLSCPTTMKVGSLNGSVQFLNGWLGALRLTSGVARYTASFTPPTAPFPES